MIGISDICKWPSQSIQHIYFKKSILHNKLWHEDYFFCFTFGETEAQISVTCSRSFNEPWDLNSGLLIPDSTIFPHCQVLNSQYNIGIRFLASCLYIYLLIDLDLLIIKVRCIVANLANTEKLNKRKNKVISSLKIQRELLLTLSSVFFPLWLDNVYLLLIFYWYDCVSVFL